MKEDTRIWPLALALASCLCQELKESGGPEPCFCGVLAGESAAWDYCQPCDGDLCGMAWVRIANVAPLQSASISATGAGPILFNRCAPALAVAFEVGVLRCAPTLGPEGQLPSMADQLEAAALQASDMAASGRAAACCFKDDGRFVAVNQWLPLGPEGGCLGGSWSVTVGEY